MYIKILALLIVVSCASAELVKYAMCKDVESPCTVTDVNINPCPKSGANGPCRLKCGRRAGIRFNFNPSVNITKIHNEIFWANDELDLPFVGMDNDGCNYATCPVNAGTEQTFDYSVPINKKFPAGVYDLKWKLSEYDTKDLVCCFILKIQLVK